MISFMRAIQVRECLPAYGTRLALRVGLIYLLFGMAAPVAMAAEDFTLTVKPGDTLRALAEEYLGDANLWPEIVKANGLGSHLEVREGMRLKIPSTRISRALRQLEKARAQLDDAAHAGDPVLSGEDLRRAQELQGQALKYRQQMQWEECFDAALQAEQLAQDALKRMSAQSDRASEATLEFATGKVQAKRGSEATWREISRGARLFAGETVRTGPGASAVLRMRNGATTRLGEKDGIVIEKSRMDPAQQLQPRITLLEGDVRTQRGPGRGGIQIRIAGSDTSVQGNSRNFWVGRGSAEQVRMVNFDEGKMRVETTMGAIDVEHNQGALLEKGRKPTVRKQLLTEPELTSPEANAKLYVRTVRLEWQRVPGAVSYWLEVARDDGFTQIHLSVKDLSEPTYTLAVPAGGAFYWSVSPFDEDGFPGPRSRPQRFIVQEPEPPTIEIQSPKQGETFRDPSILVTGELTGEMEPGLSLTLNGEALRVEKSGKFSKVLALNPGENLLELVAKTQAGQEHRVQRTVRYQPPEPISMAWAPELARQGDGHFRGRGESLVLRGTTNPDTALTLTREGGEQVARTHADGAGAFLVHVPLRPGVQRLRMVLEHPQGGTREESFEIERDDEPPGLVLEPEPPAVTGSASLVLSGAAHGATELWLGGVRLPLEGGRFSHAVTLRPGPNLLRLEAADAVGNRAVMERHVQLDRDAPELLDCTASPASVAPGGRVTVRVRARDASGLRSVADYVLQIGHERLRGHLRLNRASGEYQAVMIVPPSTQGAVRLRQLRLQDAHQNQRDYPCR
jgi:hypothetical protein